MEDWEGYESWESWEGWESWENYEIYEGWEIYEDWENYFWLWVLVFVVVILGGRGVRSDRGDGWGVLLLEGDELDDAGIKGAELESKPHV